MLRRILIIERDAQNRRHFSQMLAGEYEILESTSGEDAVALLWKRHKAISAVLLRVDVLTPESCAALKKMRAIPVLTQIPVLVLDAGASPRGEVRSLAIGANDYIAWPCDPEVLRHRLHNIIALRESASILNAMQRDKLTGLLNREAFFAKAADMITAHEPGHYILATFDIDNFKVINDRYGTEEGDRILRYIGDAARDMLRSIGGIGSRIAADDFAVLYPGGAWNVKLVTTIRDEKILQAGTREPLAFSVGRYIVTDPRLQVSAMYDRAFIAKQSVKGRYDLHMAYFDEPMRDQLLREQRIVNEMNTALRAGQFEVWFQPQYNHATGALIGAEALVRWRHPERGLIQPVEFVPVFESNGFIYEMDKFVWERTCALLRGWIDAGYAPLPVSVNVSRYDVFKESFFDTVTGLIERYGIPIGLMRLEVTESAFAQSTEQIVEVVKRLISFGFTVEIDDFGSGYSSLNTLKDVPAEILKLDMRFLENEGNAARGGNILESVVRMAKWLGMSVIAEGVEAETEANYLKSIGCNLMQGYLYARPMPSEEYERLLAAGCAERPAIKTEDAVADGAFWDPQSMDTLLFNKYVGAACIFEYCNGAVELLRANDRYAKTLGGADCSVSDALRIRWRDCIDPNDRIAVIETLDRAILTNTEAECEARFIGLSGEPGETFLRATVRLIACVAERYLFYCILYNLTAQREAERKRQLLQASDEQLRFLNATARELLSEADPGKGMERVLRRALEYYGGVRAYAYAYRGVEGASSYEVSAPDVPSFRELCAELSLEEARLWRDAFTEAEILSIDDAEEPGEARRSERELLRSLGATSLLAVSLRADGRIFGAFGVFDPTQRQDDWESLRALGEYAAALLLRRDRSAKAESASRWIS